MTTNIPNTVLTAYDADHMHSLIESNNNASTLTHEECDRLYSVLTDSHTDVVITTTWVGLARDTFGVRNNQPNQYAHCTINWDVSVDKGAWLCENVAAITHDWLQTGDGRKKQTETVDCTNTEFVNEEGVCWWPKEGTFIFIVET